MPSSYFTLLASHLLTCNVLPFCRGAVRRAHFYGVSFGVSEAIMYCSNAAAFRFGAYLIAHHDLNFLDMMK